MNVIRIQTLSKQHKSLKDFHTACNHNDVELTAKGTAYSYGEATLNYATTRLIIGEVRQILLNQIRELEQEIKAEVVK